MSERKDYCDGRGTPTDPRLFNFGNFTLHSGERSTFKIDCDALTDADWNGLAWMIHVRFPSFSEVEGVPSGGIPLADKLAQFRSANSQRLLIVDDVLTTGASMEEQRAGRDAIGVVVFARGECPSWVTPIFQMK